MSITMRIADQFEEVDRRPPRACGALAVGDERVAAVPVFLPIVPDRLPQWDGSGHLAVGVGHIDQQVGGAGNPLDQTGRDQ